MIAYLLIMLVMGVFLGWYLSPTFDAIAKKIQLSRENINKKLGKK